MILIYHLVQLQLIYLIEIIVNILFGCLHTVEYQQFTTIECIYFSLNWFATIVRAKYRVTVLQCAYIHT